MGMPHAHSARNVSVVLVRAILRGARELGTDPLVLLRAARIDPARVEDPDALVSTAQEEALWRHATERFGPTFGLHAARCLARGSFRALEYAVRSSSTFREGLDRLIRFDKLLHGAPLFTAHPASSGVHFAYQSPHDGSDIASVVGDFALASVVVIGRDAVGLRWSPARVLLAHPPPEASGAAGYAELFGCDIQFDAAEYALEIPASVLEQPMREADAELNSILTRFLDGQLPSTGHHEDPVTAVRRVIARTLPDGEPSLEGVARELGMAGRTLQKRLAASGHRYKHLAREVRAELAKRYLAEEGTTLAGVALLVGYSDLSAFVRAFKQWTGITPGEYRRGTRSRGRS
jgi:AraC-like DNA-binding protein